MSDPTIIKDGGVKRIKSQRTPGRYWELWNTGEGTRSIEHFDADGTRTTVAVMKTRAVAGYKTRRGTSWETGKPIELKVPVTRVKWEMFERRWTNRFGDQYASPEAAFKAYCRSL